MVDEDDLSAEGCTYGCCQRLHRLVSLEVESFTFALELFESSYKRSLLGLKFVCLGLQSLLSTLIKLFDFVIFFIAVVNLILIAVCNDERIWCAKV